MRRYTLASKDSRKDVDLRDYAGEIMDSVHQIMPDAAVMVTQRYYTVSPAPNRGQAIKIGRLLSKKDVLGIHCIKISKLFNGENV